MKAEVKVLFEDRVATVEFKGMWTRMLVDAAYKTMLMNLPKHIATLRERIIIPETIMEGKEVQNG